MAREATEQEIVTGSTQAARPQVTVGIRAQESQKELSGTWDEASFSWVGGRTRFQGGWEEIQVTLKGCAEICQSYANQVQVNLRLHSHVSLTLGRQGG